MEPITILIYVSTLVILAVGIFLCMTLYRIYSLLTKIDHIMEYVDHVRNILEQWEAIPVKFITKMLKKIF